MSTETSNKLYLNRPQALAELLLCKNEKYILGRGLGKTTGIVAPRLIHLSRAMPRTAIGLVGASYVQLMTRILPGVIKGWMDRGFIEGRDFFVGSYANKEFGWDRPFKPPINTQYIIHTCFGGCIVLISQDRPGSANGLDLSALVGDEAKFLNKKRIDEEIIPAMRGEAHLYGHLAAYRSTLFTSDMPNTYAGEWLLGEPTPADIINEICYAQLKLNEWKANWNTYTPDYQEKLKTESTKIEGMLNALRKRQPINLRASSLQNINVLGAEYFEDLLEVMDTNEFVQSVLTIRKLRSDKCFYADLSESKHGYHPQPSSFMETLGYDWRKLEVREFRMDEEFDYEHAPLHISIDSGGSFNCIVVGLWDGRELKYINNIWKAYPAKIKDVVLEFKQYYKHHRRKELFFYYDQTSTGTRTESELTVAQIVMQTLKSSEHGSWNVNDVYLRATPTYQARYEMWAQVLRGVHPIVRSFGYNMLNTREWSESCFGAEVDDQQNNGRSKLIKVKSSEKRNQRTGDWNIPQQRATHLSEAGDLLLHGIVRFPDAKPSASTPFASTL